MKQQIQESLSNLSNVCLNNASTHHGYSDDDLLNATVVFTHVLYDIVYSSNITLSLEKQLELAEATGKAIRELILVSTDKDMHQIAGNL